ncbi:hypothetical protein I6F16_35910 [Bradyrhizobium sp. IC4060]|nr:hypothetical protein [Bradyrhizobium sp. IC4060]MCA1488576.1 hypothetical protein [Bradyrhizobium sp. IC4061]
MRHTSIELLEGVKEIPSLLSDGPVSHLPLDEPLTEDIEVRPAARDALHALLPLGPAGVKNGQVLFDQFKTGSAARQVSSVWTADSDRCRPGFRDDLAHHSDLKSPTRSEMMSPTIPG